MRFNLATLALGILGIAFIVHLFWGPPWTALRLSGLALSILSFLVVIIARLQLGRAFSVQAKAQTLVTTGIYARIRNPIYLFGTLALAGLLLWANRPWLLLYLVVLVPIQLVRARKEERVLADHFGSAYQEYKQKTWC